MAKETADLSIGEVVENTVTMGAIAAVAAGAVPQTGITGAVIGVGLVLAGKSWDWFHRNAQARTEDWWQGFLDGCRDEQRSDSDIAEQLRKQFEGDPKTGDLVMESMRAVMNAGERDVVRILGLVRGTYYRDGKEPDALFRGLTNTLMQCSRRDLVDLRTQIGRLACVGSLRGQEVLLVETSCDSNDRHWYQTVLALDESKAGAPTRTFSGLSWKAPESWARLEYLLTSTGLARAGTGMHQVVITQTKVHQLHRFFRERGICNGTYAYSTSGGGGQYTVTLELIPHCFGYGTSPANAVGRLRGSLAWFVEDAETADLVEREPRR